MHNDKQTARLGLAFAIAGHVLTVAAAIVLIAGLGYLMHTARPRLVTAVYTAIGGTP